MCAKLFGSVLELGHQAAEAVRFLERRQALALQVLDQRDLERLHVAQVLDENRHAVQLGALRRAPAAFAGDDLVGPWLALELAHHDRLQDAVLADRLGEILYALVGDVAARLIAAGA